TIHIQVGRHGLARNGRIAREIVRADEACFLTSDRDEEYGAPRRRWKIRKGARDFHQSRRSRSIIESPVVYRVAVDSSADPHMICVRRVDAVLVTQLGIGAAEQSRHIAA